MQVWCFCFFFAGNTGEQKAIQHCSTALEKLLITSLVLLFSSPTGRSSSSRPRTQAGFLPPVFISVTAAGATVAAALIALPISVPLFLIPNLDVVTLFLSDTPIGTWQFRLLFCCNVKLHFKRCNKFHDIWNYCIYISHIMDCEKGHLNEDNICFKKSLMATIINNAVLYTWKFLKSRS